MPGALTTLLANNAMHMVPGGRRKKTRKGGKKRRGGSEDPTGALFAEMNEIFNSLGLRGDITTLAEAVAEYNKLEERENQAALDPNQHEYNRISRAIDRLDQILTALDVEFTPPAAGRRKRKTRRRRS
jgi:hypothetical protein